MSIYLHDTFQGASGAPLTGHTADSGATWPNDTNHLAGSNAIQLDGNGGIFLAGGTSENISSATMPATPNFEVLFDVIRISAVAGSYTGVTLFEAYPSFTNDYSFLYNETNAIVRFVWWYAGSAQSGWFNGPDIGVTWRIKLDVTTAGGNTTFTPYYSNDGGSTYSPIDIALTIATPISAIGVGPYCSGTSCTATTGTHLGNLVVQSASTPADYTGGGVGLGGHATGVFSAKPSGTGGTQLGGKTAAHYTTSRTGAGGERIGGHTTRLSNAQPADAGGTSLGGKTAAHYASGNLSAGGVNLGGKTAAHYAAGNLSTGGVNLGGKISAHYTTGNPGAGGARMGGNTVVRYAASNISAGGDRIGGQASAGYYPTGNVGAGGESIGGHTTRLFKAQPADAGGTQLGGKTAAHYAAGNLSTGGMNLGSKISAHYTTSSPCAGGAHMGGNTVVHYAASNISAGGERVGGHSVVHYASSNVLSGGTRVGGHPAVRYAVINISACGMSFGGRTLPPRVQSGAALGGGMAAGGNAGVHYTATCGRAGGVRQGGNAPVWVLQAGATAIGGGGMRCGGDPSGTYRPGYPLFTNLSEQYQMFAGRIRVELPGGSPAPPGLE